VTPLTSVEEWKSGSEDISHGKEPIANRSTGLGIAWIRLAPLAKCQIIHLASLDALVLLWICPWRDLWALREMLGNLMKGLAKSIPLSGILVADGKARAKE
jgi:hypothetical protein